MSEPLQYIYAAPLGTDVSKACEGLADFAWRENRPAKMTFNGTEIIAQPGDTSNDLVERWFVERHKHDRDTVATITIEVTRGKLYTIRLGDHYHDELCWDEMLGCLVRLTIDGKPSPEKAGYGGLKTKEQWDVYRASFKHQPLEV